MPRRSIERRDRREERAQYSQQSYSENRTVWTLKSDGMNRDTTPDGIPISTTKGQSRREERLDVSKRDVERGGARIRSRIIERPVEETIRLREEHVVVNRRPVDREFTDADLQNFQPGEMEITEHAEVPVVGKQARVVEEIEVGKNVTEREETIRDTVRSTDVNVEEFDADTDTTHTKSKRARP